MTRIGLISDTHSFFDTRFKELFKDVDEIWHAGDVGNIEVLDQMKKFKPTRAVYGNIDNAAIRSELKEQERFVCDGVDVFMVHIGGYPPKYVKGIREYLIPHPPKLFVTGHSHILKVMYDKTLNMLSINPGAAGKSGFHAVRTAIRFNLHQGQIQDLEVIELKR